MKIEKLKKKDYKFFCKYLEKFYSKKHIFLKSKKLFDWQYLNRGNYNFYILKEKNRIKAIQGFIPNDRYDKKLGKEVMLFLNESLVIRYNFPELVSSVVTPSSGSNVGRKRILPICKLKLSATTFSFSSYL